MLCKVRSELIGRNGDSAEKIAAIGYALIEACDEVDIDKEHFWVIGFDTKMKIKYVELASLGTVDSALVHPREVFRMAIMKGVSAIICVHNHPTGDTTPSVQDTAITERLIAAGKVVAIELKDHIVIGAAGNRVSNHYSYLDSKSELFQWKLNSSW